MQLRMDSAVRLLDHVVHCLDKSRWPFSIEEILSTLGLYRLLASTSLLPCIVSCRASVTNLISWKEPDRAGSSGATRPNNWIKLCHRTAICPWTACHWPVHWRLHAQRHDGKEFTFRWRRVPSYKLPFTCQAVERSDSGDVGAVCRTLNRFLVRYCRGPGE